MKNTKYNFLNQILNFDIKTNKLFRRFRYVCEYTVGKISFEDAGRYDLLFSSWKGVSYKSISQTINLSKSDGNLFTFYYEDGEKKTLKTVATTQDAHILKKFFDTERISYKLIEDGTYIVDIKEIRKRFSSKLIKEFRKKTKELESFSAAINKIESLSAEQKSVGLKYKNILINIIKNDEGLAFDVFNWHLQDDKSKRRIWQSIALKFAESVCPEGYNVPVFSDKEPTTDALGIYFYNRNEIRISSRLFTNTFDRIGETYIHELTHWLEHSGNTPLGHRGLGNDTRDLGLASGPNFKKTYSRYKNLPTEVEARAVGGSSTSGLFAAVVGNNPPIIPPTSKDR